MNILNKFDLFFDVHFKHNMLKNEANFTPLFSKIVFNKNWLHIFVESIIINHQSIIVNIYYVCVMYLNWIPYFMYYTKTQMAGKLVSLKIARPGKHT